MSLGTVIGYIPRQRKQDVTRMVDQVVKDYACERVETRRCERNEP
jgi:hypothetical protein